MLMVDTLLRGSAPKMSCEIESASAICFTGTVAALSFCAKKPSEHGRLGYQIAPATRRRYGASFRVEGLLGGSGDLAS